MLKVQNRCVLLSKLHTVSMEDEENILSYVNRVKQLAYILQLMDVTGNKKKIAVAVSNVPSSRYENLIGPLDPLGNMDKLLTRDYVKSGLLQEQHRSEMVGDNDKHVRACDAPALLSGDE